MKRPRYHEFVQWIADNDESADTPDVEGAEQRASEYVTTCMVADLFGVEPSRVGRDIMRCRAKEASA